MWCGGGVSPLPPLLVHAVSYVCVGWGGRVWGCGGLAKTVHVSIVCVCVCGGGGGGRSLRYTLLVHVSIMCVSVRVCGGGVGMGGGGGGGMHACVCAFMCVFVHACYPMCN